MKTAQQLAEQLHPYVTGTAKNRCMSEIDGLLAEIYEYLTRKVCNGPSKSDPTIESQMDLELMHTVLDKSTEKFIKKNFPEPAWQPVTAGLYRR